MPFHHRLLLGPVLLNVDFDECNYGPYGEEVSTMQVATVVMMTKVSKRILSKQKGKYEKNLSS